MKQIDRMPSIGIIAIGIIAITMFALLPTTLAYSVWFTPYSEQAFYGYRAVGDFSDYQDEDDDCVIWIGEWDPQNDPNCHVNFSLSVRKSKSSVGIINKIEIYYDFAHSSIGLPFPPSWTSYSWWLDIKKDNGQWEQLDWDEVTSSPWISIGYVTITENVADYFRSSGNYWVIEICLLTKSPGYFLYVDQLNAKVYWTYWP